jgi:glycosyltransferase 2 family protein
VVMVSRERTPRLGATLARRANAAREKPVVRLLGRLLAVALIVLLALRLWQLWRREPVDFGHLDGAVFAAAVVASVAAVSAYGLVWLYLLRRLGTRAPLSWMTLFFKSQLGKYLPGSVWQYAGRVGLAHNRGVSIQRALLSVVGEIVYSAVAAAAASSLILGWGAATGVFLGLAGLLAIGFAARGRVAGLVVDSHSDREGGRFDRHGVLAMLRGGPAAVGLYLVVWGVYGVAFWTTGRALFAIPASDIPQYIGVFALAWLAGLVAFFAPGGIGVREAVIAALLAAPLGQADAIVLAATSRIVLSAVDLVAGAASFGLPTRWRRNPRPVGAGQ